MAQPLFVLVLIGCELLNCIKCQEINLIDAWYRFRSSLLCQAWKLCKPFSNIFQRDCLLRFLIFVFFGFSSSQKDLFMFIIKYDLLKTLAFVSIGIKWNLPIKTVSVYVSTPRYCYHLYVGIIQFPEYDLIDLIEVVIEIYVQKVIFFKIQLLN